MENYREKRAEKRIKRALRVRKPLKGSQVRPRLSVQKTNRHIAVQLIDDEQGVTLASSGTMSKEYRNNALGKKSKEAARHIGTKIAELAKEKQIDKVVFDRGRFKFHGLIAELANAAREAGLQF